MAQNPASATSKINLHLVHQKLALMNKLFQKMTHEDIDIEALNKEEVITYYNSPFKATARCEYDIRFHFDPGYDQKTKRCDRHNLDVVRDNIYREEAVRKVPIVVSHIYGKRRTNLEGRVVASHKKCKIMKELLRRYGINLRPDKKNPLKEGYSQL